TLIVIVKEQQKAEQLNKQLNKQIYVIKVSDITDKSIVARELALVKVSSNTQTSNEIRGLITPFRADVIDIIKDNITIQVTGKPEKTDALVALLRPYGIKELARTGVTAFLRGHQPQTQIE